MKAGWEQVVLGNVCSFENGDRGKNYPGRKAFVPTGVPFINAGHLTDGRLDLDNLNFIPRERFDLLGSGKVHEGDLLFCLRGSLGKFAVVEGLQEGAIASSLVIVRAGSKVNRYFLSAYFSSRLCAQMIEKYSNGAAQPNLSAKSLRAFEIPLPPLPEQERIVAILDEAFEAIDTAIANTEKNLVNARELFDSTVPQYVYAKSLMADARSTDVASVALPVKGSIRTGPFGSQLLKRELVETGIPVLGIDNVVHNEFRWGKARFINEEKYKQLSRYTVKSGDVLITIMGTCGRCAVVPDDIPLSINTKHLCCISLDQSECLPEYLRGYFLHHSTARDFLVERAKGSIMDGLNMRIIKELPLLLPTIDAQGQIVDRQNYFQRQIDGVQRTYETKIATLGELKQSILHKAFSGELTASAEQTLQDAGL